MALKYPELFTPFHISKLEIKNRIIMTPMHLGGRMDSTGNMTDKVIDYYEARAKGGFGLIVTGGYTCAGGAEKTNAALYALDDPHAFNTSINKAAEKLNAYDAQFFVQVGAPFGRVAFLNTLMPEMNGQPVAPSAVPSRWDPSVMCRALTTEECYGLINDQIEAAVGAVRAGANGICVGGPYGGYFADQFCTRAFNKRDDEFGFAQGGQYRVVTDVIRGIKEQCGQDYPVMVRLCVRHYMKDIGVAPLVGEDYTEVGRDIEDSLALAKELEAAGADAILIGGGVGGMEAAMIAAQRGHDVDLYEKSGKLGGLFNVAAVPEFKTGDHRLLAWYARAVEKAGVKVHLNTEITAADIEKLNADEIIVATGAKPKSFPIPGAKTMTASDALCGENVGKSCVVIGGGLVGCETAVWLARKGVKVTLVEALPMLMSAGAPVPTPNFLMMLDMLPGDGVAVYTNAKFSGWADGKATILDGEGKELTVDAETVVQAVGFSSDNGLYEELIRSVSVPVWNIGDSREPANVMESVRAGYYIAKTI